MSNTLPEGVIERATRIRCIITDVDGVLTDGKLVYLPDGSVYPSGFHVHDGMGIRAALEVGLSVVIISGNWTEAVRRRAEDLRVSAHYLGVGDKMVPLRNVMRDHEVSLEEIAYIGDDLNDLAPLQSVGLACTVPNSAPEAKQCAHYVTTREGGAGAVREIIEVILRSKGLWEEAVARFLHEIDTKGLSLPGG